MKLRYHLATLASALATYLALQTIGPTWLAVISAVWMAGMVAFAGLVHEQLTTKDGTQPFTDTLTSSEGDQDQWISDSDTQTEEARQSAGGAG